MGARTGARTAKLRAHDPGATPLLIQWRGASGRGPKGTANAFPMAWGLRGAVLDMRQAMGESWKVVMSHVLPQKMARRCRNGRDARCPSEAARVPLPRGEGGAGARQSARVVPVGECGRAAARPSRREWRQWGEGGFGRATCDRRRAKVVHVARRLSHVLRVPIDLTRLV